MIELGPKFWGKKELVIKRWEKNFSLDIENFNLILTYILLPELHPYFFNPSVIVGVAKVIGSLVTIEWETWLKLKLVDARFIVNLDITKPLMKEIQLNIEDKREWIQPSICKNFLVQYGICKSFDHYAKSCLEKKLRDEERRIMKKSKNFNYRRDRD